MKKLLLIAILCLFVANAYALETKIYGNYKIGGTWLINKDFGDDGDKGPKMSNATWWDHFFRVWAEISPEPGTKIVSRTTIYDRKMGKAHHTRKNGAVILDRAWIQYDIIDGLTVYFGRLSANNYATYGWAQGWYNADYEESGAGDGIKVQYKYDNMITAWAVVHKASEGSEGFFTPSSNSSDKDNYIVGVDLKINDFKINPRIAYSTAPGAAGKGEDRISLFSVYADAAYLPATGINVIVAGAYVGGDSGVGALKDTTDDSYAAFGFYGDVAWKADMFKVGVLGAYSSWDKKKGAFEFGGDFDKTIVLDDELGDAYGMPAATIFQIYGDVYLLNKDLTISPSFAYYFSNISKKGYVRSFQGLGIGKDFQAFEIDLKAKYKITNFTSVEAGYGIVMANDINDKQYDADPVHKLYWTVETKF